MSNKVIESWTAIRFFMDANGYVVDKLGYVLTSDLKLVKDIEGIPFKEREIIGIYKGIFLTRPRHLKMVK